MNSPYVVRNIPRPTAEQVKALAQFGVATVHEAYKQRGLMRPEMRPVTPNKRVCGPAVTALCHQGDNLMLHAAIEQCQPGDVIVVANTAPNTDGMIGELIATSCKALGIAGVILDAGARDTQEVREMGFGIWSVAVSASGTVKATPGWVNVPIVCAGTQVNPGDVVLADDDGVVVVALEDLDAVIAASDLREKKEAEARKHYQAGELTLDVNNMRPLLESLGVRYYDDPPK